MLVATILLAAAGPIFGTHTAARNSPPQAFSESARLPGKPASTINDLVSAWQFGYTQYDAQLESGSGNLIVVIQLTLHEDASYELMYSARWSFGRGIPALDGVTVNESGSFSWSGEVLILEPATTQHAEIKNDSLVRQQSITNDKHVWIAHVETRRLHIAGRCARYQVDPACRLFPNVWYSMSAELGRRWLKR